MGSGRGRELSLGVEAQHVRFEKLLKDGSGDYSGKWKGNDLMMMDVGLSDHCSAMDTLLALKFPN
jgi:hypothetical protein